MISIGMDPGKSGGIVALDAHGNVEWVRLSETEHDVGEWLSSLVRVHKLHAILERVSAMPRQGVASTFKFGRSYGFLRGLLVAFEIPFEEVTPGVWQRAMGCLSKGDKNVTKAKAQQLFPSQKVCHWNADALLIADYGRRVLAQRKGNDL